VATIVSDAHPFRSDRTIDLSRLNEAERRVLRLLAEGHTAKSIAIELGTTSAAVNERLREARRKTGVGSSRELARVLKAQESRDEQMGVANPSSGDVDSRATADRGLAHRKGWIAMSLALLAALGAAAIAFQQPPPTTSAPEPTITDPLIGTIAIETDPRKLFAGVPKDLQAYQQVLAGQGSQAVLLRLHAQVRSERRDDAWSSGMEAKLHRIYKSLPSLKYSPAPVRVLCSATLCEVATTTSPHPPEAEVKLFFSDMQSGELAEQADAAGLDNLVMLLAKHSDKTQFVDLTYWARKQ
jgi:DNA-binding CsgD family transcriptional regulator